MKDLEWDKLLGIKTSGRDDTNADSYRYPYEPTPYSVLERLANEGYLKKGDVLLDYGCGKGRVDFFLAYQTKCTAIGIEYDERIFQKAVENKESANYGGRVSFVKEDAQQYEVPADVNAFYFFNPFSVELLSSVLLKIKESYYNSPREMLFFFYYPSDEYIARLMQDEILSFDDEVDCGDLFESKDERERVMVFRVDG